MAGRNIDPRHMEELKGDCLVIDPRERGAESDPRRELKEINFNNVDPRDVFLGVPVEKPMTVKEAAEIIGAGLAWAQWTPKQREALEVARQSMDELERIKDIEKLISQEETIEMAEKYKRLMPWLYNYLEELNKEWRSTKNHIVTSNLKRALKNQGFMLPPSEK